VNNPASAALGVVRIANVEMRKSGQRWTADFEELIDESLWLFIWVYFASHNFHDTENKVFTSIYESLSRAVKTNYNRFG
jgi:hypothetical protein